MHSTHQPRRGLLALIAASAMTVGALTAGLAGFAAIALAPAPAMAEVVQDGSGVTFRLDTSTWTDRPRTVHLAGSFNNWDAHATPMPLEDGVWQVTLTDLREGRHSYKFVIDGDRWITDPTDDPELREDDNYGGHNSGVIVGPDIRDAAPPRPGHVNTDFVMHDPASVDDAMVLDTGVLRLRVRTQAGDVEQVLITALHGLDSPTPGSHASRLVKVRSERGFDVWEGRVDFFTAGEPAEQAAYFIELRDGEATFLVMPGFRGAMEGPEPEERPEFFTRVLPQIDVPEWAKHAVWYQIFPERFRNGNPDNDPGVFSYENLVPWNSDWWSVLPGETPPSATSDNFYTGTGDVWNRRYGGDIQGVKEKLPYLRELGVTAIYFNPVFEGESMHKYDTADFRHIDANFGVLPERIRALRGKSEAEVRAVRYDVYPPTPNRLETDPDKWEWTESDKVFLDFVAEAHRQGFRVIIDGVFNHVGRAHPYFLDVLEKGPNSEFADWFDIIDWGDPQHWRKHEDPFAVHGRPGTIQWNAWDQRNGHLPTFKKDPERGLAEGPYNHIMAITKRWLAPDGDPSRGVDGWRLDVPGDIPHPFWRDWRKVVKETKPDAYIVGEIWNWAQPWLQGDQFDATMNYQFAMPTVEFLVNQQRAIAPSEFHARLERVLAAYPTPIVYAQQNLFDSHDTDRLASMFVNPDRPYDGANRPQDNALHFDGPMYSERKPTAEEWTRFKQAIALQHGFVGAPMTYYGNEAGMWSPDDPSNRQPFPWPDKGPHEGEGVGFNEDIFAFFQRAKAVRNALPALREGTFAAALIDDDRDLYGFVRRTEGQTVYVVLNRSSADQTVTLQVEPGVYVDHLDPSQVTIRFEDDAPVARPQPRVTAAGIRSEGETLTVTLPAFGTAYLVRM